DKREPEIERVRSVWRRRTEREGIADLNQRQRSAERKSRLAEQCRGSRPSVAQCRLGIEMLRLYLDPCACVRLETVFGQRSVRSASVPSSCPASLPAGRSRPLRSGPPLRSVQIPGRHNFGPTSAGSRKSPSPGKDTTAPYVRGDRERASTRRPCAHGRGT